VLRNPEMKISKRCGRIVLPSAASTERRNAFALVESMIGMALVALTLGCMFAANAHVLSLLRQGKEATFATQMIQERLSALRGALWDQVTDPAKLSQVLTPATVAGPSLPNATETIKVEPLVNGTNLSSQCTRIPAGTVSSSGPIFTNLQSVKVTVSVQWSTRKKTRVHAATTILTNGGI
jgi:hypothetical protein